MPIISDAIKLTKIDDYMNALGQKRLKYFENSNSDPSPELTVTIREIDVIGDLINAAAFINYPGDLNTIPLVNSGYIFYTEDPSLGSQSYHRWPHTSNDPRANSNVIVYIPSALYKKYFRKLFTPKFLLNKIDPSTGTAISVPIGCYTFQRGKSIHLFRRKNGLSIQFPDPWNQQTDWQADGIFESDITSRSAANNSYVNQKIVRGVLTCNAGTTIRNNIFSAIEYNMLFCLQNSYGAAAPIWTANGLGGDIRSSTTEIDCEIVINQADFNPNIRRNVLNLFVWNGYTLNNISLSIVQETVGIGLPQLAPSGSVVQALVANEFVFTIFSFSVTSFTKANLP